MGDHTTTFPKTHLGCHCTCMASLSKDVWFYPQEFSLKALDPTISAAALKRALLLLCQCSLGLSAQTVFGTHSITTFLKFTRKAASLICRELSTRFWGWVRAVKSYLFHQGTSHCSICAVRLGEFSLKILSYGKKPLWEQVSQLLLSSQTRVHFPLLGNEWELFHRHQIAAGPLEVELWPLLYLAACRVQMMKSKSGTNKYFQRCTGEAR